MKTVRLLHAIGELNDRLLPVGKESVAALIASLSDADAFDTPLPQPRRPGSSRRKQYYDKATAACLRDCAPRADEVCTVHIIDMKLTEPATGDMNPKQRVVHDMADAKHTLALLSTKDLPSLPIFCLYARQGTVTVQVRRTLRMTLTSEQVQLLVRCIDNSSCVRLLLYANSTRTFSAQCYV